MTRVSNNPPAATIREVAATEVQHWLSQGQAVLVDVREPAEHQTERIDGASLNPLSRLNAGAIRVSPDKRLVLHCKGGVRSRQAAALLIQAGFAQDIWNLAGGIEAWKKAGLPTVKPAPTTGGACCAGGAPSVPSSDRIMRQVQFIVGSAVIAGSILAATVSPWFLLLTGFAGAGLLLASFTGVCPMAGLLVKMPWNSPRPRNLQEEPTPTSSCCGGEGKSDGKSCCGG